jgi:hypothetical protein
MRGECTHGERLIEPQEIIGAATNEPPAAVAGPAGAPLSGMGVTAELAAPRATVFHDLRRPPDQSRSPPFT